MPTSSRMLPLMIFGSGGLRASTGLKLTGLTCAGSAPSVTMVRTIWVGAGMTPRLTPNAPTVITLTRKIMRRTTALLLRLVQLPATLLQSLLHQAVESQGHYYTAC